MRVLSSWGVRTDAVGVYMARRYGGLFFGYLVILWMARASHGSPAHTAILAGGFIVTALMAVVSLVGLLSGLVGPMVWSAVAVEVLLAAFFAYHYLADRRQRALPAKPPADRAA
ncbi:MAG TPA: hypothetical protein VFO85_08285 [Vicinamibacteria bacterium]|nr:hypothetical protein [Vicinamibacteria bacterium]